MQDSEVEVKGPIRKRKFTNVYSLLIFIIFFMFVGVISIYAYSKGDKLKLNSVFDADENICGQNAARDFPYVYIDRPISLIPLRSKICINKCPRSTDDQIDYYPNSYTERDNFSVNSRPTKRIYKRLCLQEFQPISAIIKQLIDLSYLSKLLEDINEVWPILPVTFGILGFLFLFFMYLLRYYVKSIVYGTIVTFLLVLVGFGLFFWIKHNNILDDNNDRHNLHIFPDIAQNYNQFDQYHNLGATSYGNNEAKYWKYLAIFFWVISGIYLIIIYMIYPKVKQGVEIIESGMEFVYSEPSVYFIVIIFMILLVSFVMFAMTTIYLLSSIGTLSTEDSYIFTDLNLKASTKFFLFWMYVALFWGVSVNISQIKFSISAMAASWYFERHDKKNVNYFLPVLWSFTYHLGTMAIGSFLISFLWPFKKLLSLIYSNLKENINENENNEGSCANGFVNCYEKSFKQFEHDVLIETALRNVGFFEAAKIHRELKLKHFKKFGAFNKVSETIIFMVVLTVTCKTTILMNIIIQGYANARHIIVDTIGPVLLVLTVSLFISLIFFYVIDVACYTLLHCLLLDEEDGKIDGKITHKKPAKLVRAIDSYHEQKALLENE